MNENGKLYLVATPIGNLGDISKRALEILSEADRCLAEDTRRTSLLLRSFNIQVPLTSFHEHNEDNKQDAIIAQLEEGAIIALVTDAGTPLISDPGFTLVRRCRELDISVESIPGASAVTTALILSGFPPYPYTFLGYPPKKKGKRGQFWDEWLAVPHTLVLFSTPHAVIRHLEEIRERTDEREIFIGRELTKRYEEQLSGKPEELIETLKKRARVKGEITLVIGVKLP